VEVADGRLGSSGGKEAEAGHVDVDALVLDGKIAALSRPAGPGGLETKTA
jgi:hypothetical protein